MCIAVRKYLSDPAESVVPYPIIGNALHTPHPTPPHTHGLFPFQLTQTVISCLQVPSFFFFLLSSAFSCGSPSCVRNFRFGCLSWELLTHTLSLSVDSLDTGVIISGNCLLAMCVCMCVSYLYDPLAVRAAE